MKSNTMKLIDELMNEINEDGSGQIQNILLQKLMQGVTLADFVETLSQNVEDKISNIILSYRKKPMEVDVQKELVESIKDLLNIKDCFIIVSDDVSYTLNYDSYTINPDNIKTGELRVFKYSEDEEENEKVYLEEETDKAIRLVIEEICE